MVASLCPLPFPERRRGTMPVASPLASFAQGVQPGKALLSTRRGPSLCWEGRREDLSPLWGGKLTSEGISPKQDNEAYDRRLGTYPERQDLQAHGEWIPQGDLLSSPGNAHGGRAAKFHCGGLAEGIISTADAIMMDKTGWSSPIGATR
jgi:hypothetical protein